MNWFSRLWPRRSRRCSDEPTRAKSLSNTSDSTDVPELAHAIALYRSGQLESARAAFEIILADHPTLARAHYHLGLCELGLRHVDMAADAFVLAVHFDPSLGDAHFALATAEQRLGRFEQALESLDQAAAIQAPDQRSWLLRGTILTELSRIDEAIESFERCLALSPGNARAHANLGYLLFAHRAAYDLGAGHIEQAYRLDPADVHVQSNRTLVLLAHRQDLAGTIEACDQLLRAHPDRHEVRLNRGIAKLKSGRYEDAWDDYEARKLVGGHFVPRGLSLPEWDGNDARDKTLLVYAEQGLGDEILFASCFEEAIDRVGQCVVECSPRLHGLFARSFPRAEVVPGRLNEQQIAARRIDLQCAAGSLPKFFRRSRAHFSRHRGYLRPDPACASHWKQRLDALGASVKVGLSWQGGALTTRRALRSLPLERFAPLINRTHCTFVDLQYGDTRDERAAYEQQHGIRLIHWSEAIEDLDAGAALIAGLDLVISVCTTAAHMTGALGRPTWILVPSNAEWRYLASGESMPWHPSVRMFRQEAPSDWGPVLNQVGVALGRLAG